MNIQACCVCMCGLTLGIAVGAARAQSSPTPSTLPAAVSIPETIKNISDELQGGDPAGIAQAVKQIRQLLQLKPPKNAGVVRTFWLKRLLDLQRYDDVLELSQSAILASPADTSSLEQLQTDRVQAFLAQGKSAEALAAAKQLFDISTLKGTADAIRIVCQCLNAVHPDDREVLRRYRKEQIDGAKPDGSLPSGEPSSLSGVQIDPTPYTSTIREITSEDYRSLTAEGNLMLLAGNAKDAWDVFERAYTMASDRDLAAASESLARCMKAQDGTIGRANAWVLSIRPREQLASGRTSESPIATTQASRKE